MALRTFAAGALFAAPLCCAIIRDPCHASDTTTNVVTTTRLTIQPSLLARASRERTIVRKDALIRPARGGVNPHFLTCPTTAR